MNARKELADQIADRNEALRAMLEAEKGVVSDSSWLVVTPNLSMPMVFDIDKYGNVKSGRVTNIENATRLSRWNANHLAQSCKDGLGNLLVAKPVVQVIEQQLADSEKLLADLTKA